jgi:hypothetical protein
MKECACWPLWEPPALESVATGLSISILADREKEGGGRGSSEMNTPDWAETLDTYCSPCLHHISRTRLDIIITTMALHVHS